MADADVTAVDAFTVARLAASFPRRRVKAAILEPIVQLARDTGCSVFDIPDSWLRQHQLEKALVISVLKERGFAVADAYDGITAMAHGSVTAAAAGGAAVGAAAPATHANNACVISRTTVKPPAVP
jgi:hypothetical protein